MAKKKSALKVIGQIYAWTENGGDCHVFFDGDKVIHSMDASDHPFDKYGYEPLFSHLGVEIENIKSLNPKQKAALKKHNPDLKCG